MRLPRVHQKDFGSTSAPTTIGKFGSLAAGTPEYATTGTEIQELANFLGGWPAAIVGINKPAIEDMNALFVLAFQQIAYMLEAGIPEWITTTTYSIGSYVQSSGVVYRSLQNANTGNALTDSDFWVRLGGKISEYTTSQSLTEADEMVEFDCTGGDCVATFPAASSSYRGKKITVTKTDSGANMVSFAGVTGAIQLLGQYDSVTYFCNGSVWYAI